MEIWAYLALEASERIATRFVDALKADLDRLLIFPLSGAQRDMLFPGGRALFHGRYVVYYRPTEQEVLVVRILHAARDAAALADQGGFSGN